MSQLILKIPTIDDKELILNYKKEWMENSTVIMNGACGLDKYDDINNWFLKINYYQTADLEELAKNDRVRQITYLALLDNKIVGMVGIRPFINEKLIDNGTGHVGYGVSPLERKKGYGSEILKQALMILRNYGVKKAVVGCYQENIASKKVIINNGGILDKEWVDEDGKNCLRFHINL